MIKKEYKKIGNTSFRVDSIKKMSLKDFKKTYESLLPGLDLGSVYKEVTGSSSPEIDIEK